MWCTFQVLLYFKQCEYCRPLEIGFLKLDFIMKSSGMLFLGTFLEGSCHLQLHRPFDTKGTFHTKMGTINNKKQYGPNRSRRC